MGTSEKSSKEKELELDIRKLRGQLAEAWETLRAIREGEVDALVVTTSEGQRIFTLQGADHTYRTIIEQMHEGAITLAEEGRITYSNRRFAEMVKRPLEQVIGSYIRQYVVESDQEGLYELIRKSHNGNARGEATLRAGDRAEMPVGVSLSRMVLDGFASICAVFTDLTERKRAESLLASEQQFRSLAESIPHMVWSAQPEGVSDYCNSRFLDFVGQTPEQMQEWMWASVVHPDDRQRTIEAWLQAFTADSEFRIEHRIRQGTDGEFRWHVSHAMPYRDDQGRVIRWFGTSTDIHDRKCAEEALRENEEHIRASLEEKEVLLKEIHHRVKNNMQVVSSLLALQAARLSDPTTRTILDDVTHRVRSMALVHEKLYCSTDLAHVEFAEYVRSLLTYLWRAHETAANVRLDLDLERVPLSINTAVPCGLILNELVSNTLKHAFNGHGDGTVTVSLRGGPGGEVCLRVRDNGTGLPVGFDWRNTDSLGLRLVHMLAEQLHATVEVRGEAGTEFAIRFGEPTP
ncbi:MAG: PAS domain S-box protein [Pirellulaceae bacterium]